MNQPPQNPQQPPDPAVPPPVNQPPPAYPPPVGQPPMGYPPVPPQSMPAPQPAPWGYPPPYGPPPGSMPMPPGADAIPGAGTPPPGQPGYSVPAYGQPGAPPEYTVPGYAPPTGVPPAQYQYPYPPGYPPQMYPPQLPPPARSSLSALWIGLAIGAAVLVVVAVLGVAVLSNRNHAAGPNGSTLPPNAYSAPVPGPGCDTKGGQWTKDDLTQVTCTSGKMHITSQFVSVVTFSGPTANSTIPTSYEVSVTVSPLDSLDSGLLVHETASDESGYAIDIGNDGFWSVFNNNGKGSGANLPSGNVSSETTYHLDVIVRGTSETIKIDGTQVGQFTDTEFTGGDSVGLIAFAGKNTAEADFQNFTYTPLS